MDRRVTINVPEAPPDEHDGEDLLISTDDRNNLLVSVRRTTSQTPSYDVLAIYARGFWADAKVETLES